MIDYCRFDDLLTEDERAAGERVREFVDRDVRPIIAGYYERGEFPKQLIPQLIEIGVHPRYPRSEPIAGRTRARLPGAGARAIPRCAASRRCSPRLLCSQ